MKTSDTVRVAKTSFFRDFVDNSGPKLQKLLLTKSGRDSFSRVKSVVRNELGKITGNLPCNREDKLLRMAMIRQAVSQILCEIAMDEDEKSKD